LKTASFEELCRRSAALPYEFPTSANRLRTHCGSSPMLRAEAEQHARLTRPLVHERAAALAWAFLKHKQRHGRPGELAVYNGMDLAGLFTRLLAKRPLVFMTSMDDFLLRDGRTRLADTSFEKIGTSREKPPLRLRDYQSYEEMELSALLAVSVPTHFINTGSRKNAGVAAEPGSYAAKGVYVALVGARFERTGRMEWRHMLVTAQQNTPANGYGAGAADPMLQRWAQLYGLTHFPTFEEAQEEGAPRFLGVRKQLKHLFDTKAYAGRCKLIAETFLLEANDRAEAAGASAFCHIVGLGLGVWQVHPVQMQIQVDAYAEAAARLELAHVGELYFSWFKGVSACGGVGSGGRLPTAWGKHSLRVTFGKRDPADPFEASEAQSGGKPRLLVAQYAWDSNAYPGNEYWTGLLTVSGDPAAACCSLIPELQNPDVNTEALAGQNVHVVLEGAAAVKRLKTDELFL